MIRVDFFSYHGIALLVQRGALCRVPTSGEVKVGDPVEVVSQPSQ